MYFIMGALCFLAASTFARTQFYSGSYGPSVPYCASSPATFPGYVIIIILMVLLNNIVCVVERSHGMCDSTWHYVMGGNRAACLLTRPVIYLWECAISLVSVCTCLVRVL